MDTTGEWDASLRENQILFEKRQVSTVIVPPWGSRHRRSAPKRYSTTCVATSS